MYFDLFVQVCCLNHGPTTEDLTSWTIHCHHHMMSWYVDGLEFVTVFVSTTCDTVNTSITLLFLVFHVVFRDIITSLASCPKLFIMNNR